MELEPQSGIGRAGRYYAVAFDFIGAILAGVFGGWFLDHRFGMNPYGTPLLVVLGVAAGVTCFPIATVWGALSVRGIDGAL